MKRLDTSEFIRKAHKVHGKRYDYSKVCYKETHTAVEIICPKHGVFEQTPAAHLSGRCCPKCSLEKRRGLIRGVARNDTLYTISDVAFRHWKYLLKRCFPMSEYEKLLCRSYADVGFYEPWLLFSNFKLWFDENYVEGYVLDKDLLSSGKSKRMYSPDTCCFIPKALNNILQTEKKSRQIEGMKRFYNKSHGRFEPKMCINGKTVGLGWCYTEEEAIEVYKNEKKKLIDKVAKEYFNKGLISERIYKAFLNYKVVYG